MKQDKLELLCMTNSTVISYLTGLMVKKGLATQEEMEKAYEEAIKASERILKEVKEIHE